MIESDKPITTRRELAEVLRVFYEAEKALTQPKPSMRLRAYRALRAATCKHSSAIPNRYDCLCSKCLAEGLLVETVWCSFRSREVCRRCACEYCPFYEYWRDRAMPP